MKNPQSVMEPAKNLSTPVVTDQGALVENIYDHRSGQAATPDYSTQAGHQDFLKDRMRGKITRFIPGRWERVEEIVDVKRPHIAGWTESILSKKQVATLMIATNIAVNAFANRAVNPDGSSEPLIEALAEDTIEDIQENYDGWADSLHPDYDKTWTTREVRQEKVETIKEDPSTIGDISIHAAEVMAPGETTPNPVFVKDLASQIKAALDQGYKWTGDSVVGHASDEYGSVDSLNRADAGNADTAGERAVNGRAALEAEVTALGISMPEKKDDIHNSDRYTENILSPANKDLLVDTLRQYGYSDIKTVERQFKQNPDSVPPVLRDIIAANISFTRGNTYVLRFEDEQGRFIHIVRSIPVGRDIEHGEQQNDDGRPRNDDHEYDFDLSNQLFTLLPLVGLAKAPVISMEPATKTKKKWRRRDSELPDNVWVELYPDAVQQGDQLTKDAWSMSRKYQVLLRENRVNGIHIFNYKDASGKDQTLRTMFVDHDPTPETVAALGEILQSVSQMRGGKMGDHLGMIAVFPRDNAGNKPKNAKRIGLGLDEQYELGTYGVAMPAMGLVEMHMPTNPSKKELEQYMGSRWVFAHEIAGHFTDLEHKPTRLSKVIGRKGDYTTRNPWAHVFSSDTLEAARAFDQRDQDGKIPARWRVTRDVSDIDGRNLPKVDYVTDEDPRLQEAVRIEKRGAPSRYATSNPAELYAEIAAGETADALVPTLEFYVRSGMSAGNFATGHAGDPELVRLFTKRVNHNPYTNRPITAQERQGIVDSWSHQYEPVRATQQIRDRKLFNIFNYARTTELPARKDLVRILTQVTRSQRPQ